MLINGLRATIMRWCGRWWGLLATCWSGRDKLQKMKHTAWVRQHTFSVDEPESNGGEDLGMTPHDVCDSDERRGVYRLRVTLDISGALILLCQ